MNEISSHFLDLIAEIDLVCSLDDCIFILMNVCKISFSNCFWLWKMVICAWVCSSSFYTVSTTDSSTAKERSHFFVYVLKFTLKTGVPLQHGGKLTKKLSTSLFSWFHYCPRDHLRSAPGSSIFICFGFQFHYCRLFFLIVRGSFQKTNLKTKQGLHNKRM